MGNNEFSLLLDSFFYSVERDRLSNTSRSAKSQPVMAPHFWNRIFVHFVQTGSLKFVQFFSWQIAQNGVYYNYRKGSKAETFQRDSCSTAKEVRVIGYLVGGWWNWKVASTNGVLTEKLKKLEKAGGRWN